MAFENHNKLIKLAPATTVSDKKLGELYKYVAKNLDTFSDDDFGLFINVIEIIPEKIAKNIKEAIYIKNYLAANEFMLGLITLTRLGRFLQIVEELETRWVQGKKRLF